MSEKKKVLFVVLGLSITTIFITITGAIVMNLHTYYNLSKNGVETQGTVTSKNREEHQYIFFEYIVEDHKFQSGGHAEDVNKNFDSVQLNEKVSVYYDPINPEIATLGNPEKQLRSSAAGVFFISLIPSIFFAAYRFKKK